MAGRDSVTPGHQEMVTVTTPWLRLAIWVNSCSDRSTTRPGFGASRSSTVQVVVAPVASLRTVRTTPWGSVSLAQPPGNVSYQVAPPVALLPDAAAAGAGAAVVVVVGGGGGRVVGGAVVVGGAAVVVVDGAAALVVDGADVVEAGSRGAIWPR